MPTYAYTTVPGKLPALFENIPRHGIPKVANSDWLIKMGFPKDNDTTLLMVLRFIGFIDHSNKPTDKWSDYVRTASKELIARAILDAYPDLVHEFKEPWNRKPNELKSFFMVEANASEPVATRMASTFRNLCKLAEFRGVQAPEPTGKSALGSERPDSTGTHPSDALTLNDNPVRINITINLPETKDEAVYRSIFKALRENLFK